jgi:hypothetical protein
MPQPVASLVRDLDERRWFAERCLSANLVRLHDRGERARAMLAFARRELDACDEQQRELEQRAALN